MDWSKQIIRYVVIMALQVLLFDQLQLGSVCHPFIYILCLMMMPITLPRTVDMIIGAAAGLVMDIFCNSLGIHMAACILMMYLRPHIIGELTSDKDRINEQISLYSLGIGALLKYVAIMIFVHHFTVFMIAAWSWSHFGFVLLETIVSGTITYVFIIGYNMIKYR